MPRIKTVYLIHHSHTDLGFTNDQPVLFELQARFIYDALDMIERTRDSFPPESAFHWTVESTAILEYWLQHASDQDIERLILAESEGFLEVTAMFANITPLYDIVRYIESLKAIDRLRSTYGLEISSAMNCDVNGHNWPLADVLLDAGIEGFSMAINHHFGGTPIPRPSVFRWQAPSGRKLLALNGWQYGKGGDFGIGAESEEKMEEWWPKVEAYLEKVDWPLPILMLQAINPYGDNASVNPNLAPFIREWNGAGRSPQIVFATPRMWWQAVNEYAGQLNTLRGDWTDFWNFGCISTARQEAIARANVARLSEADALYGALSSLPPTPQADVSHNTRWADRAFELYRDEAWRQVSLWGEHTWTADCGVGMPQGDDSLSQSNHKANRAFTARSLSLLLQRDALADFAQHVKREAEDDLLIFNPLPWDRQLSGPISRLTVEPRGVPTDTTASRHYQGHFEPIGLLEPLNNDFNALLPPIEVPGFGYAMVSRSKLIDAEDETTIREDAVVENGRYRLIFDRDTGGVRSLVDKEDEWEWVDQTVDHPLHGFVHEEVADRSHDWPRNLINEMDWTPSVETERAWKPSWWAKRNGATNVTQHKVYRAPIGTTVEQHLEAPGVDHLVQRLFLPRQGDHIVCESQWDMDLDTHPQANYLLFPFNLPGATARFDAAGQPVVPEEDQLPGVCRDYFTVHRWVDLSNERRGVTVAMPENPMVQLGDFHFGHNQLTFELERAMLLGWVTSNYWETNFPGHQPGTVVARYYLLPHAGGFDETRAHRFGAEAAHTRLLAQHMREPSAPNPPLPKRGQLLEIPQGPVTTLHVRAGEDGLLIRLLNASDETQLAAIKSGLLKLERAWRCDLFDHPTEELPVQDGVVHLELAPRRLGVLRVETKLTA